MRGYCYLEFDSQARTPQSDNHAPYNSELHRVQRCSRRIVRERQFMRREDHGP